MLIGFLDRLLDVVDHRGEWEGGVHGAKVRGLLAMLQDFLL